MKIAKLTLISASICLLGSLLVADAKPVKKDGFLQINPNIKNEALRSELDILKQEFDGKRDDILKIYEKEIQYLIEKRQAEVSTIKVDFSKKRELILTRHTETGKLTTKPYTKKKNKSVVDKSKLQKIK